MTAASLFVCIREDTAHHCHLVTFHLLALSIEHMRHQPSFQQRDGLRTWQFGVTKLTSVACLWRLQWRNSGPASGLKQVAEEFTSTLMTSLRAVMTVCASSIGDADGLGGPNVAVRMHVQHLPSKDTSLPHTVQFRCRLLLLKVWTAALPAKPL